MRATALSTAALVGLGRKTVTNLLVTAGMPFQDWSASYRLFSRDRFDPDTVFAHLCSKSICACRRTRRSWWLLTTRMRARPVGRSMAPPIDAIRWDPNFGYEFHLGSTISPIGVGVAGRRGRRAHHPDRFSTRAHAAQTPEKRSGIGVENLQGRKGEDQSLRIGRAAHCARAPHVGQDGERGPTGAVDSRGRRIHQRHRPQTIARTNHLHRTGARRRQPISPAPARRKRKAQTTPADIRHPGAHPRRGP